MKDQTRNIASFPANTSSLPRNHLLVIAIDRYLEHSALSNAVRDAKSIVNMLTKRFDYEVDEGIKELYDERGTREELYKTLLEYQRTLTKADTLLIWFGGHGTYNPDTESGYWVPVNAANGENAVLEWIDFDWLLKQLTGIRAGHIALIADSCHSGAALQGIVAGGVRKKENLPAPWILTSGRCDESVNDGLAGGHSPFARCLLDYLERYNQPALLFSKLEEVVLQENFSRKQQPCCRQISGAGDGSGQYVFRLREDMQRKTASAPSEITPQGIASRLRENSARYYQRLRNGRFKLLNISDLILTESSPRFFDSVVRLDRTTEVQSTRLPEMLHRLWQPEIRNVLLMGDGGMGKTVACVRLWEQWVADSSAPIPLFISLNEYNAVAQDEERTFLKGSLYRHYLGTRQPTPDEERAFQNFLETPDRNGAPIALLILDGLNEVTREKGWLEKEIRDFIEGYRGVHVLITTRYDLRNFTFLQHFEKADLQPLRREQVEDYLKKEGKTPPQPNADDRLWSLLGNPMMLTLFAATGEWVQKCRGDDRFYFKEISETTGELLWNFTEAQFAKLVELTPELEPENYAERCDFFLRFLVPWIGFQMELRGQFILPEGMAQNPEFNLAKLIREGFAYFDNHDFFHAFPRFRVRNKEKALLMLREPGWEAELSRFDLVKTWLCEYLRLFVQEEEALRFAHQNFRDFFAAFHLRNTAEMALSIQVLPETWKARIFTVNIRSLMGEIEGEHYFKLVPGLTIKPHDNLIGRILNQCRNDFKTIGATVWNAVTIIYESRKTLAGVDLNSLNLTGIHLKSIPLSLNIGSNYLAAKLDKCLVSASQFVSFQITYTGTSILFHPIEQKLLITSSSDFFKKVLFEFTFDGNLNFVQDLPMNSLASNFIYSNGGNEIITAVRNSAGLNWRFQWIPVNHAGKAKEIVFTPDNTQDISGFAELYLISADEKQEKIVFCIESTLFEWSYTNLCLKLLLSYRNAKTGRINCQLHEKLERAIVWTHDFIEEYDTSNWGLIRRYYTFDNNKIESRNDPKYNINGDKIIAVINGEINIWHSFSGKLIARFKDYSFRDVEWGNKNNNIISLTNDEIIEYDLLEENTWQIIWRKECTHGVLIKHIGNFDKLISVSKDSGITVFNRSSKEWIHQFNITNDLTIEGVAYDNYEKKLFVARGTDIEVWQINKKICLSTIRGHEKRINNILYSDKNDCFFSSGDDSTIRKWDIKSGNNTILASLNNDPIKHIVLNDNGDKILFSSINVFGEYSLLNSKIEFICKMKKQNEKTLIRVIYGGKENEYIIGTSGIYGNGIIEVVEKKILDRVNFEFVSKKQFQGYTDFMGQFWFDFNNGKILYFSMDGLVEKAINNDNYFRRFSNGGDFELSPRPFEMSFLFYSPNGEKILVFTGNQFDSLPGTPNKGSHTLREFSTVTGEMINEMPVDILPVFNNKVLLLGYKKNFSDIWWLRGADFEELSFGSLQVSISNRNVSIFQLLLNKISKKSTLNWWMPSKIKHSFDISPGAIIHGCTFRDLHPDSQFTEEEKNRLRRFGAIFDDEDERRWKEAIADAYGDS